MNKRTFTRVPDSSLNVVKVNVEDLGKQITPPSSTRKQKSGHQHLLDEINKRLKKHSEALVPEKQHGDDRNPYNSPRKLPIPPQEVEIKSDRSDNTDKITSKLPVSSSRQKRRSALTKRQGGRTLSGLQPVLIEKYRPDYAWNRGGRVKELRIRTVGRKFLHIWISKVYGRVSPLVARTHFKHKLLTHALREWREVWWTNVKEWRLTVRAECQYRYILWNRVFRAWKLYVIQNKARQYQLSIADNHAKVGVLGRSLSAWKEYHRRKKEKENKKKCAQKFLQEKIMRKAWTSWLDLMVLQQQHKQMDEVSLQFWAYRIQIQHWLQWRHQFEERAVERMRLERADQLHQKSIKAKSFNSLMAYVHVRKFKKNRKEFANKVFTSNVMERFFEHWKESLRMKRSLAEHQDNIIRLARSCVMRKALVQWKLYISERHRERERREMADVYYLKHLLSLGFNGLRLCVVQRKIQITRNQLAQDFHDNQKLQQAWNVWLKRCEESEEVELLPLSRLARHHHRHVTLRKCWTALIYYKRHRQTKQEKYLKAEAYYYWKSLPKYFFRMKVFVQIMKKNQEEVEQAVNFRRENVQARFFYHWFIETKKSQDDRMSERMAILHYDEKVTRRFLSQWRKKTQEALENHQKEVLAKEHFSRCCCKGAFREWRNFVLQIKISRKNDVKSAQHHYVKQKKKAWSAWKMYHRTRLEKKQKLEKAVTHFKKQECRLVLDQWKLLVHQQQQLKAKAERMFQNKCIILQRLAFQTWRDNAQELVSEKLSSNRAEVYHHNYTLLKVFKTWHRFSAIHAYKKSETKQLVEDGRQSIGKGILRRTFVKWREARDQTLMSRLKFEQAVQHHDNNTKINVLKMWKTFVKTSQRKKLLNRQADWFRQTVLRSQCILRWKYEYSLALENQSKTNLALWHWSLTLQKNVLMNWWKYCQYRKQKKSGLAEALGRRRSRLLKDGVTQWIKVAQEFRQMRAQFAAQQHTKTAYESFQLVQKYALHWKQMTVKRKAICDNHSGDGHMISRLPLKSKLETPFVPVISMSPVITSRSAIPAKRLPAFESNEHLPVPIKAIRARPRRPDFLVASLKRDGLLSSSLDQTVPLRNANEENIHSGETVNKTKNIICDSQCNKKEDSSRHSVEDNDPPISNSHKDFQNPDQQTGQVIEQHTIIHNSREPTSPKEKQIPKTLPSSVDFVSQSKILGSVYNKPVGNVIENSTLSSNKMKMKPNLNPSTTLSLTLLTPSTFLTRKDGTPIGGSESCQILSEKDIELHGPSEKTTENKVIDKVEIDSCASSPRYDFQFVSKVKGDSMTTQAEIVQIRDRLKLFDKKKKKLKELKSQWKHLNSFLGDHSLPGDSVEDVDTEDIREELSQINEEMVLLRSEINREKPVCSDLVKRVQHLIQQQHG